jgi:hypothetical protein
LEVAVVDRLGVGFCVSKIEEVNCADRDRTSLPHASALEGIFQIVKSLCIAPFSLYFSINLFHIRPSYVFFNQISVYSDLRLSLALAPSILLPKLARCRSQIFDERYLRLFLSALVFERTVIVALTSFKFACF